ncbi:hypothetical protein ANO14919_022450 [Xylariales sp. No.14919]|nr:hypothetical protein ANO14919_022450 [Xylariales sp. No.14919]
MTATVTYLMQYDLRSDVDGGFQLIGFIPEPPTGLRGVNKFNQFVVAMALEGSDLDEYRRLLTCRTLRLQ